MMLKKIAVPAILGLFLVSSCGKGPAPITQENFLTLADVTGRTSYSEDSPDIRVINIKSKAFIKQNNIRSAKQKALEIASKKAVETMVRELLSAEKYNQKYQEIENYFSKNIDKYIAAKQVNGEREIFGGKYYGISASFKISRQKVLVALQKDLKFIDTSSSTLVTVITSKKDLDMSSIGIRFSDIESALLNQIQTDLNQRGLRAMDFRNAAVSLKTDSRKYNAYAKLSKEQFMAMISGSKAEDSDINAQVEDAQQFYSTGLSLLKELAKVVVEVNIMSISKTNRNMVLNANVTAKNISIGTGGAFANAIVQVARRAGPNTDDSAMVTGLIKDAYSEMLKSFIPQVMKEMSSIDVKGNKLIAYELVFKGYKSRDMRSVRRSIERAQDDKFRYIDYDNTLMKATPSINIIHVRYADKSSRLGDRVMGVLDDLRINTDEPIVAPAITDLVFEKLPEEEK